MNFNRHIKESFSLLLDLIHQFDNLENKYHDRLSYLQKALATRQLYTTEFKNLTAWVANSQAKLDEFSSSNNYSSLEDKTIKNEDLYNLATGIANLSGGKMLENYKNLELQTDELLAQCMDSEKLHLELNIKQLKSNFYHLRDESKNIAANCESLNKLQGQIDDKLINVKDIIANTKQFLSNFDISKPKNSSDIKNLEKELAVGLASMERIKSYEENQQLNIDKNILSGQMKDLKELIEQTRKQASQVEDYELSRKVLIDKLLDVENRVEIIQNEISAAQVSPDHNPDPSYLEEISDTVAEWKLAADTLMTYTEAAESSLTRMENQNHPATAIIKFQNRITANKKEISEIQAVISEIMYSQEKMKQQKEFDRQLGDNKKWLSETLAFLDGQDESMITSEQELDDLNKRIAKKIKETSAMVDEQMALRVWDGCKCIKENKVDIILIQQKV